ncbi:MAG: MBL fold metallo-hydrolase [Candidatus Kariarchaeaceae archaeon]
MILFHQISLNLPFNPHKIHSYVFRDENNPDEVLLLDSGVNQRETISDLESELKKIDTKLGLESITSIISTHAHIDHIGALELIKENSRAEIIIHKEEYEYFKSDRPIFWVDEVFEKLGVPEKEIEQFHFYLNYYHDYYRNFVPDITFKGDFGSIPKFDQLKFLQIPGHTPHHIALFLDDKKAIFTGDTLLSRITPNLGFSGLKANPVKEYLSTLTKLSNEFHGWTSYPAHQAIVTNIKERSEILRFLLEERLENVDKFFKSNGKGLPSLVKYLYPTVWPDPVQRFLALMETSSYIKYFFGTESPFKAPFEEWA